MKKVKFMITALWSLVLGLTSIAIMVYLHNTHNYADSLGYAAVCGLAGVGLIAHAHIRKSLHIRWLWWSLPKDRFPANKDEITERKSWALRMMRVQGIRTVHSFREEEQLQRQIEKIPYPELEGDMILLGYPSENLNLYDRHADAKSAVKRNKKKLSNWHTLFQEMGFYTAKDLNYNNLISGLKIEFEERGDKSMLREVGALWLQS